MTLSFTRIDFRITRAILLLVAIAAPVLGIGRPLWRWLTHRPLQWRGEVAQPQPLPESMATAAPGIDLTWDGRAVVALQDPSTMERLIALLPPLAAALLICAGALILWRLVGRAQAGVPFVPESVRSLRRLALLLVVGGFGVGLLNGWADQYLLGTAVAGRSYVSFFLDFTWLAVGMLVFALSEVFRIGARLAADVDGLV